MCLSIDVQPKKDQKPGIKSPRGRTALNSGSVRTIRQAKGGRSGGRCEHGRQLDRCACSRRASAARIATPSHPGWAMAVPERLSRTTTSTSAAADRGNAGFMLTASSRRMVRGNPVAGRRTTAKGMPPPTGRAITNRVMPLGIRSSAAMATSTEPGRHAQPVPGFLKPDFQRCAGDCPARVGQGAVEKADRLVESTALKRIHGKHLQHQRLIRLPGQNPLGNLPAGIVQLAIGAM